MTEDIFTLLEKMKPFHNESKFIRQAIYEKFIRDFPTLIAEQKRKQETEYNPFT